jgi:hypothetical protein
MVGYRLVCISVSGSYRVASSQSKISWRIICSLAVGLHETS